VNILRKLLIKTKLAKGKPHEKAELGQGTWGRQSGDEMPAKARPKANLEMRVYRKETDTWEEIK
jgi:hypothetical protein